MIIFTPYNFLHLWGLRGFSNSSLRAFTLNFSLINSYWRSLISIFRDGILPAYFRFNLSSLYKSDILYFNNSISLNLSLNYYSPLANVSYYTLIFSYNKANIIHNNLPDSSFLLINYVPNISLSVTTNSYSSFNFYLFVSLSFITKCNLDISPT